MFRRKFIKATGATIVGSALAGCSGSSSGSTETTGESTTEAGATTEAGTETSAETGTEEGALGDLDGEWLDDEGPEGLEVTSHQTYETDGEVGLEGVVANQGEVAYESVQVEVTLQDDQGELLYEFIDETEQEATTTLEPGAEWEFNVVFEEAQMNEVANYTIELDGDAAQSADDEAVGNESASNETTMNESTSNETTTTESS
ncbi:DUF3426 domain-containing protein [Halogeometricum limi]|uniref:Uncharacterized protein n=1 Tax=Halogeometricum limi TaxID=555875 RepID=A0A1I6FRP2_9EURY|nr:DUF3426 domain-containing protein [Halogeometricum limi]SFR32568.1 Protein of unknown function [Halogeometricum limi]